MTKNPKEFKKLIDNFTTVIKTGKPLNEVKKIKLKEEFTSQNELKIAADEIKNKFDNIKNDS